MAYLLAQYALLFLLTALVSFLLGRWWTQRHHIDITESWETLRASREAEEAFRDRLWTGLEELRRSIAPTVRTELAAQPPPEIPEPNLDRILMELKRLETRIDGIKPTPVADLKPVHSRLDTLDARFSGLQMPSAPDLTPVLRRLEGLEQRLEAIGLSQPVDLTPIERRLASLPAPEPVDLSVLERRLEALETTLREVAARTSADELAGIQSRLDALVRQLSEPPPAPMDPRPLTQQLQKLEQTLATLPRLERQDLQSIQFRLGDMERLLREAAASAERSEPLRQAPAADPAPAEQVSAPELLEAPTRGAADDLKRISGVGPKLEQLLNDNGVFYFSQVASWSDAEVRFMDDRLEIFRGRIERDRWVDQAQALATENNPSGSDLFSGS